MRRLHFTKLLLLLAVIIAPALRILADEEVQKPTPGIIVHKYTNPQATDSKSRLPQPIGAERVVVNTQNRVFYSDSHYIYELKPGGRRVHFTGSNKSDDADGAPAKAGFSHVDNMLALPDGRLLVTDNGNVRLIDTAGNVRTIYKVDNDEPPPDFTKLKPKNEDELARKLLMEAAWKDRKRSFGIKGLAIDKNGTIYATAPLIDTSAIFTLELSGKLEVYAKIPPADDHDQAIFPGIAVDKNLNVYVAVLDGVCKISKHGSPVPYSAPVKDPPSSRFPRVINQMQFDSEGNLWVVGEEDDRIMAVIAPDGSLHTPNKGVKDKLQKIEGMGFSFDRAGSLYIASSQGLISFAPAIWKARVARPVKK